VWEEPGGQDHERQRDTGTGEEEIQLEIPGESKMGFYNYDTGEIETDFHQI